MSEIKKYIEIVNEAVQWNKLSDAGPSYSPGETQIWYWKSEFGREMMMGYNWLIKHEPMFEPSNIRQTHTMIGSIAETNPNKIYNLMQGEIWSPEGQARKLIQLSGAGHTSMSVGDIIVVGGKKLMVDNTGFVDLATGKPV